MRLKELRKGKKLRQVDVCEALSCSQSIYSRYENDERTIPTDMLVKISDFFGVSVDYLLQRNEIKDVDEKPAPLVPLDMKPQGDALVISVDREADLLRLQVLDKMSGMNSEQLKKAKAYIEALAQEGL